ncbi:MAG: hypothetical protein LBC69_04655, partial [Eubacteriaceae bacterium]|nr:hypothetical protein [Eubacteriaceae bacterium]
SELFEKFPYSDFFVRIEPTGQALETAVIILSELVRQYSLSSRVVLESSRDINNILRRNREVINVTYMRAASKRDLARYNTLHSLFLTLFYGRLGFQHVEISLAEALEYPKSLFSSLSRRNVSVYITGVNNEKDLGYALELDPDGIVTSQPELISSKIQTDAPNGLDHEEKE